MAVGEVVPVRDMPTAHYSLSATTPLSTAVRSPPPAAAMLVAYAVALRAVPTPSPGEQTVEVLALVGHTFDQCRPAFLLIAGDA